MRHTECPLPAASPLAQRSHKDDFRYRANVLKTGCPTTFGLLYKLIHHSFAFKLVFNFGAFNNILHAPKINGHSVKGGLDSVHSRVNAALTT